MSDGDDHYSDHQYPDNPLVRAVALHSRMTPITTSSDFSHDNWKNLSKAVGCVTEDDSLECMRRVPVETIIEEAAAPSYNWYPVQDNVTVFTDYVDRAKRGLTAKLPTLLGITSREASVLFPLNTTSVNETDITMQTIIAYHCPAYEATTLRLEQNIPTWRYLYHGNWPNLDPRSWLGAYHTSEIPILFGSYNLTGTSVPATPQQIQMSKFIQGAWVAFAKDPLHGLEQNGWSEYDAQNKIIMNLAVHHTATHIPSSGSDWDAYCQGDQWKLLGTNQFSC